jgi:hypothetical protein
VPEPATRSLSLQVLDPHVSQNIRTAVAEAIGDAVPFLVITVLWIVVMLVVYGLFLVTKPGDSSYDAWVHASVFLVPGVGFLGHVLQQALKGGRERV